MLLLLFSLLLENVNRTSRPPAQPVSYTLFKAGTRRGNVKQVTLSEESWSGPCSTAWPSPGTGRPASFRTSLPPLDDPELLPLLEEQKVEIHRRPQSRAAG